MRQRKRQSSWIQPCLTLSRASPRLCSYMNQKILTFCYQQPKDPWRILGASRVKRKTHSTFHQADLSSPDTSIASSLCPSHCVIYSKCRINSMSSSPSGFLSFAQKVSHTWDYDLKVSGEAARAMRMCASECGGVMRPGSDGPCSVVWSNLPISGPQFPQL